MKRLILIISVSILTFSINAQDSIPSRFSYSLSWTPIYHGPNDGEFRVDAIIPLTFETKVHFRLLKKLSVSSGVGFQGRKTNFSNLISSSIIDPIFHETWYHKSLWIPIQTDYFLKSENGKLNPYIKSEFVYESNYSTVHQYQFNEIIHSFSYHDNSYTIDFGFGTLIKIKKSINLLTEGSIGTHIINDPFDGYLIKIKIGILIK